VRVERVVLVVCDGVGIGDAPDAAEYGDAGSNTLGNTARAVGGMQAPNLGALGIGCLMEVEGVPAEPRPGTAHGRLTEVGPGKDSATGHWELAGLVLDEGFPLYPEGFPPEVIEPFEAAIGREVLGNRWASGTEIIAELGQEHMATGRPIVYTSGDSVFQVACHERVVDPEALYGWCRMARGLLRGKHNVGRVIARPFSGTPVNFVRTPGRRDFAVPPPSPTLLDRCVAASVSVYGVGKIADIFSERGLTEWTYSSSDDDGVTKTLDYARKPTPSLVFANLVDLDTKYGHRNDPEHSARCIEAFDIRVPELLDALGGGLLFVTGDHGCDPTTPSTDHSRERVPVLVGGVGAGSSVDLGTRQSFADLGATVADLLEVSAEGLAGESFAEELW